MRLVKLTPIEQALAREGFKLAEGDEPRATGERRPRKPMPEATKAKIKAGIAKAKAEKAKGLKADTLKAIKD